jgi:anti-sigma factor ChrR (cupin superfamily)
MRINDDMTKPVRVRSSELPWVPSPAAGVDRRMLFRIGGEVARATSIVRYAPASAFPRHTHEGGEEILVLEGTFQDEHGDYPAGTYFRNPPGTSHVPAAKDGCTIFVRLWQYRKGDDFQMVRKPGEAGSGDVLFDDGHERVTLQQFEEGEFMIDNSRGLEFLVVSGSIRLGGEGLDAQSWGRLPSGTAFEALVAPGGTTLWIKDAPLLHPDILELPADKA